MEFTYSAYRSLLRQIKGNGYRVVTYTNKEADGKLCILRHDLDMSVSRALPVAELETSEGVSVTYFVLLSTDMYNPFSKENLAYLKELIRLGHSVGLHFDEMKYESNESVVNNILTEARILSEMLGTEVQTVSMHRPSAGTLKANYQLKGLVNSYSQEFFKEYKYISDSRMNWRENPYEVLAEGYDRLHILTHPFWYHDEPKQMRDILLEFCNGAAAQRYMSLKDNLRDLEQALKLEEVAI